MYELEWPSPASPFFVKHGMVEELTLCPLSEVTECTV